jgi:hypothetical protein
MTIRQRKRQIEAMKMREKWLKIEWEIREVWKNSLETFILDSFFEKNFEALIERFEVSKENFEVLFKFLKF